MNAPDRHEHFVVPEGSKKVTYKRDLKVMNAATFILEREDHTLGNAIRNQLLCDPKVTFAGYKMPHPLQHRVVMKVQTTGQSSPMQAYESTIVNLKRESDHIKTQFENEVIREQTKTY